MIERDPSMARELGIGRPDRPDRRYDDGGLVDLNHASAQAIIQVLELDEAQAAEIVRVRDETNGFASCAEVGAYTSLPPTVIDGIRERAVFIHY